jgi:hypothetical protein
MFDSNYLGSWDLDKTRDTVVEITKVVAGELTDPKGGKKRCPVIFFKEYSVPYPFNKTNCRSVAAMYGTETDAWVGKKIALYVTPVEAFKEMIEAIRVRPMVPK